jgi:hypothetical protein
LPADGPTFGRSAVQLIDDAGSARPNETVAAEQICVIQAQPGVILVVNPICQNIRNGHSMNRLALLFLSCLGFGSLGVGSAAAQYAPQAPISPRLPSAVIARPSPVVAPKPSATQGARSTVAGSNRAAKEPEQMKVVRLYRGEGYFDAGLAEKLRPTLAKAFGITPASSSKPGDNRSAPDLLRSILGQDQGSAKNADQTTVAKAGQP